MNTDIELLKRLSKNPSYVMTEEEIKLLRDSEESNSEENHKNKNRVATHSTKVAKHDTQVKE